jgi:hypothetical protein
MRQIGTTGSLRMGGVREVDVGRMSARAQVLPRVFVVFVRLGHACKGYSTSNVFVALQFWSAISIRMQQNVNHFTFIRITICKTIALTVLLIDAGFGAPDC